MSGNTPPPDKQPSRNGADLPSDCLSSIPMPKNWNQVEELKSMKHKLQQKIAAVSKHYEREKFTKKYSKSNVDETPSGCASEQAVVSKAKGCLQLACDSLETSRPHHKHYKHKKHKHKKHKNKDRSKSHHDTPKCGSSISLIDTLDHKKHLISNVSEASDLQNIALMKPLMSKQNILPASTNKCFPMTEKVNFESIDDTMEVMTAEKINQALSHAKICAKENKHRLHTSDKITNIVGNVIENPLETVKCIYPKVVLKDLSSPKQNLVKLTNPYKDEKPSLAGSSDRKKGPKYSRKSDEKCIEKKEKKHLKSFTNEISYMAMPMHKKVDVNSSTVSLPLSENSDRQNKVAVSCNNDQLSFVTDETKRRQLLNKTNQCLTNKVPSPVERKPLNNDKSVQQSKGSQTYKEIADMKALKKLLLNKQKLILMKLELEMKKQGLHEDYALKKKLAQVTKTGELELQNIKKSLIGSKSLESVSLSPPVTSTTDVEDVSGVKMPTTGSTISSDSNSNIKNSVHCKDTSNADNLKRNPISLNAKTDTINLKPTSEILDDKSRSTEMQSKTIFQTVNSQNCNTQTCDKPGYQISKAPTCIIQSVGMPISSTSSNNVLPDIYNRQTDNLKFSSYVSTFLPATNSSTFVGHSVACPQNSVSSLQTFIVPSSNTVAGTQTVVFPPLFPRIPVVPRGIHIAGHSLGIEYTRANSYVNTYLSSAGSINASQMMGNSVNNRQQFSTVTLPVGSLFGSSNLCSDGFRPVFQNVNGALYPVLSVIEPGCADFHQKSGSLSSDIRNAEVNTESEHNKSTICISAMNSSEKQQPPTILAQKDKKYRFHSGKPQHEQTLLSTAMTDESCCTTGSTDVKPVTSHTFSLQTTAEKQGNAVPVKLYGMQKGYLSDLLCRDADIQQMSVDTRTSILQNKCLSNTMPVEDESKLELFEQFKVKPSATSDSVAETEKHPKEKVDSLPKIENYYSLSENTFEKLAARQNGKNGSGSEAGVNKSQTKNFPQKHRVVNITLQSDNLNDQPCHMPSPASNSSPKDHQILAENELLEYLRSTCNEKTKLILLKGHVCDKWERVKKNVCAEAMSDPEFLHYLLNTVEEALHKSQSETDEQPTGDQTSGQLLSLSETESRMAPQNELFDPATRDHPSVVACPDFMTIDSDDSDHLEIIDIDGGALSSPHTTEEETDVNNNTTTVLDHGNDTTNAMKSSRKRPASEPAEELPGHQTSVKRLAGLESRPAVEVSDQLELAMGPAPTKPLIKSEGPAVIDESPAVESFQVGKSLSVSQELSEGTSLSSILRPITTKTSSSEYLIQQYFREKMYTIPSRKDIMWYIDHFRGWLRDNGLEEDFEHKTAERINALLQRFYIDVAKRYSKASYCFLFLGRIRDHMFTYLRWLSSNKVNLKDDSEFKTSNQVYSLVSKVDSGFVPSSKSTVPFTEEDEVKLRNSGVLSDKNPENLLWKVYFDIIYYLGEETFPKYFLHNLKKDSLVLSSDERGRFYTFKHEGWPPHWAKNRKMYESLGGSETCPVKTMKLYLGKLSGSCNALFQTPKARCCTIVGDWYKNTPLSQKKLNCIMSEISKAAQLSKFYSYASVALLAKKHKFLGQLKKIE